MNFRSWPWVTNVDRPWHGFWWSFLDRVWLRWSVELGSHLKLPQSFRSARTGKFSI